MDNDEDCRVCTIRALNDRLRIRGDGGEIVATRGLLSKGQAFMEAALSAMRKFDDFNADNDPHGEHDFGRVEVEGQPVLWKIDYYDAKREYGSDNPADPAQTARVLTVMLAHEY